MKNSPSKSCRVLVTGAGSGVGQGIIKALRISRVSVTIISADIAPMNAALYRADEAVIIPRVEMPDSLGVLMDLLKRLRIDVVMVGSEFDLMFFSKNKARIEAETGTLIVASAAETVEIADDKWKTVEFLRKKGLPHAEAYLPLSLADAATKAGQWHYPLVLKSRRGTSSRNVHIVTNEAMLEHCYPSTPQPMLQRMIDQPTSDLRSEYTCSVFKGNDGRILGPFTARRTLRGGSSWHVEVAQFTELHEALLAIGESMDFMGSLNVQLMLTPGGPVPFELNARFSGTTAIRAHFGFNEPEMALISYFYKQELPIPVIRSGIAMRYLEEVFVEGLRAGDLTPGLNKGEVCSWF